MNRRRQKKLARKIVTAAMLGDAPAATALLRAGAQPNTPNAEGTTPLYAASVHGDVAVARLLLAAGAAPDTESGHGTEGTPLCAAAAWGHLDVVRILLAHGADPNLREDGGTGHTPLDWATKDFQPHPETAAALIAAGARPRDV
ncbi:ankyrin repeat domain-containing protein [Streptomyces chrestomyceticus]|uniref:ankyrin repeat domain-containing protein n=1 Tax=Streptomyces chrestomyceticus TaxID=68185 RepID=UPI0035A894C8